MANTSLTDLNDYLFQQMKKLSDNSLSKEEINQEIKKAEAITNIADSIIKNGELALKTAVVMSKMGKQNQNLPMMLTNKTGEKDGREEI